MKLKLTDVVAVAILLSTVQTSSAVDTSISYIKKKNRK